MSKVEAAFHQEMVNTYNEAARLGYRPTRFLQMVNELGGLRTAHRLLATDGPSEGLGRLWELERLDISLEAIVLKPQYADLFSEDEIKQARQRLADVHYKPPWDKVHDR